MNAAGSQASASARIDRAAALLRHAEAEVEPIEPLVGSFPGMDLSEAYAIQLRNIALRREAGARVVGHKVGLTSAAMQAQLGVSEPDFGHLLDDMVLDGDEPVALGRFIAARVEPEIAFVLGDRLVGPGVTRSDVLAATASVAPCFELIDSRIADWRITLLDTVADNGSAARVRLGRAVDPGSQALDRVEVVVSADEVEVARGRGDAVLGHPAAAVAWLANALAGYGVALEAGHIVLPGSMTAAITLEPAMRVVADFGPLGAVALTVGDAR